MGSVWFPSCCTTGTHTPRRVKAATRQGHPASYPGRGARPEGSSAQASLSLFMGGVAERPLRMCSALAAHPSSWRLRCRRGARLATGHLCVPAAAPLRYLKMSTAGLPSPPHPLPHFILSQPLPREARKPCTTPPRGLVQVAKKGKSKERNRKKRERPPPPWRQGRRAKGGGGATLLPGGWTYRTMFLIADGARGPPPPASPCLTLSRAKREPRATLPRGLARGG